MSGHPEQPHNLLAAAYRRGRDPDWQAQKRHNHRRWRRRSLAIGSVVAGAGLVAMFLVYDYPRESGLTDALGLTCGEYIHVGEPGEAENPFEQWVAHLETLDDEASVDTEEFLAAVGVVSEEVNAEPILGHFRGRNLTQRKHSETVAGGQLLIGHHETYWTVTDRVSLLDPSSAEITWTAQTINPVMEYDVVGEARQPVLYGVGGSGSRVVLQTPTYRGDTDLVIAEVGFGEEPDCMRLDGSVDTQQILSAQPEPVTAWSQIINLNAGRLSDQELLVHHGGGEGASEHQLSLFDISTGEAQQAELPLELDPSLRSLEVPAEAQQLSDEEFESLRLLGENHYLLTWEAGSVILQRR